MLSTSGPNGLSRRCTTSRRRNDDQGAGYGPAPNRRPRPDFSGSVGAAGAFPVPWQSGVCIRASLPAPKQALHSSVSLLILISIESKAEYLDAGIIAGAPKLSDAPKRQSFCRHDAHISVYRVD